MLYVLLLGCNNHKPVDRSEILQLARNKYFFLDDGTPSLRLVEDEDDNGKTIEEPELYRPIHMHAHAIYTNFQ
jgi:hypothetical protein